MGSSIMHIRHKDRRVQLKNIVFLFLNQNICCGCSKEPSRYGSFDHPKHMFELMDKKIIAIEKIA